MTGSRQWIELPQESVPHAELLFPWIIPIPPVFRMHAPEKLVSKILEPVAELCLSESRNFFYFLLLSSFLIPRKPFTSLP
jgi:hypothetical protein